MFAFTSYFFKHDPAMVERRLQTREKVKEQKAIMKLANLAFVASFVIPGLDQRSGWTRGLAERYLLWLRILAQALVLAGYLSTPWVIGVNRFASRTIQVEPGKK